MVWNGGHFQGYLVEGPVLGPEHVVLLPARGAVDHRRNPSRQERAWALLFPGVKAQFYC